MEFLLCGCVGGQAVIAVRESGRRYWASGVKLREDFRDYKRTQARARNRPVLEVMGGLTCPLQVSFDENRESKKLLASLPYYLTPREICLSGPNYDQQRGTGQQSVSDRSLEGK